MTWSNTGDQTLDLKLASLTCYHLTFYGDNELISCLQSWMAKVFTCGLQKEFKWVLLYMYTLQYFCHKQWTTVVRNLEKRWCCSGMMAVSIDKKPLWYMQQLARKVQELKWNTYNVDSGSEHQNYSRLKTTKKKIDIIW